MYTIYSSHMYWWTVTFYRTVLLSQLISTMLIKGLMNIDTELWNFVVFHVKENFIIQKKKLLEKLPRKLLLKVQSLLQKGSICLLHMEYSNPKFCLYRVFRENWHKVLVYCTVKKPSIGIFSGGKSSVMYVHFDI